LDSAHPGAAARQNGLTYGQLIHGLKAAGVSLDRKVLADMAVLDAGAFAQLSQQAKSAAPAAKKENGVTFDVASGPVAQAEFAQPCGF